MITKTPRASITLEDLINENQELRDMLTDLYAICVSCGVNPAYVLSHPENQGKYEAIMKYLKNEAVKPKRKAKV